MSEIEGDPASRRQTGTDIAAEEIPQAIAIRRGSVSLVWIIPLVAVAIGAWLAFKTFMEQGPIVRIEFKTASGIQAGKTKVKFKDVDVGQVTGIAVSEDLTTVIVTAQLTHGAEGYLTEHTRFWVERPRVTASGISGLDTLLSGPYIALDPVTRGPARREFRGLEEPPLITTSEPGIHLALRSPTLGSLNIGAPVYYRQIQVGQVIGYALDQDSQAVSIEIFVSAPHDALISGNTRFWNASGVDISLTTNGISVDTQSLLSVLIGGIAFDTPDTIALGHTPADRPAVFPLYPNREEAYAKTYSRKERYLLFFKGSVRGLAIGAPVLLMGIDIGKVLDIQLQFSVDDFEFEIPVLIEVEPDRISVRGDTTNLNESDVVRRLVEAGLRGQLKTSSLLTGQLYVDLDIHTEAARERLTSYGEYQVIPTLPAPLEALTTKLTDILDKLDTVPLEQIGRDLGAAVAGANALINSDELKQAVVELRSALAGVHATTDRLNGAVAPELVGTLRHASATLKRAGDLVAAQSPLTIEMQRMFQDVSAAARSLRTLLDYLERHPEALIQGKGRGR